MNQMYDNEDIKIGGFDDAAFSPTESGIPFEPDFNKYVKTKFKLKVYVDDSRNSANYDIYYVERSAAYILGLLDNNRDKFNNYPRLVVLPVDVLKKLMDDEDVEIEFVHIERKRKVQVYIDGFDYCISMADAYELELIKDDLDSNVDNNKNLAKYYYIDDETLRNLGIKYEVEFCFLEQKYKRTK